MPIDEVHPFLAQGGTVSNCTDFPLPSSQNLLRDDLPTAAITARRAARLPESLALTWGGKTMLGLIALVLIVLWLLGFHAFHVGTTLIHILLVIGLIVLVFHFLRDSARTA
jgi:Flp pilus assembly protein TadB